jgi:hypothetical protein
LSGTLTGGSLQLRTTINGVITPQFIGVDGLDRLAVGTRQSNVVIEGRTLGQHFNAGDTIGLTYTQLATIAPTNRAMSALVVVLYEDVSL